MTVPTGLRRMKDWGWFDPLALACLCVVHVVLVWDASARMSPTIDEFSHLPAGLTYLDTRTFRVYPHNPPLPRVAAALAAATQQPRIEMTLAAGRTGEQAGVPLHFNIPSHLRQGEVFLLENMQDEGGRQRYFAAFLWGRRAIGLWSALTIPVLFLWGRWWLGRSGGWTAAWLWAWGPNIIAHAGLVTADLAAASLSAIAAYAFARWLGGSPQSTVRSPQAAGDKPQATGEPSATFKPLWSRALIAGVALGTALLTKFSVVLLVPMFAAWTAAQAWRERRLETSRPAFRRRWQLLAILGIALAVLNAGYLFEGTGTALDGFEFASDTLTRPRGPGDPRCEDPDVQQLAPLRINRFKGSVLGMLPAPVPAMYLVGFDRLKYEAEGGKYDQYLRGHWQRKGYLDYYLYGLLVKWPLSTHVLLALAVLAFIVSPIVRAGRERFGLLIWLVLAGVPLAMLSFMQDVNLGLRYALPAFPFLFLLAASAMAVNRPAWCRVLGLAALAWNPVSVLRVHPHELAYFNEAAGGPQNGRYHLIDSNLDWGQDLIRLVDWIKTHPEWADVRIAYWGPISPEVVGLPQYRPAPRDLRKVPPPYRWPGETADPRTWGPQPGRYAISVNFERGMGFRTPCPIDWQPKLPRGSPARHGATLLAVPPGVYTWFQQFTPRVEPAAGYSILLYDISKADANRARRSLGLSELP